MLLGDIILEGVTFLEVFHGPLDISLNLPKCKTSLMTMFWMEERVHDYFMDLLIFF